MKKVSNFINLFQHAKRKCKIKAARTDGDKTKRQLACYYCRQLLVHRIRVHLHTCHEKEPEVAKAMAATGHEKEVAYTLIRNKGNFKHNIDVLASGKGELIFARTPEHEAYGKDYLPCIHCYAFYKKDELWRHIKFHCVCYPGDRKARKTTRETGIQAKAVLLLESCIAPEDTGLDIDSEFRKEVLDKMMKDPVYQIIVTDPLILAFGQVLYSKLGRRRHNNIAQRMRQLGRLRKTLDKHSEESVKPTLNRYISGKGFDEIVDGLYDLAGYTTNHEDIKVFLKPGLALRIGHNLTKLAQIKRGLAIRRDDSNEEKEVERFLNIKLSEWPDRVSTVALVSLNANRFNKPSYLPLTSDLVKLSQHMEKYASEACSLLTENPNYENWRNLAEVLLCQITLFNKRRGGEVEELRVKTYKEKDDTWRTTSNEEIMKTLKPMEKELFER